MFETDIGSGAAVFLQMLHALGEPLLVMGAERRVRFSNAAADAALGADSGLTIRGDILGGEDSRTNTRLIGAVAAACAAPGATYSVLLKPRLGGRCSVLHLSALGRKEEQNGQGVLVIAKIALNDTPRVHDIDQLRQAFGLSQAESDIAMLIAAGVSPRQIAIRRKNSEDTVRWHIRNIYSKTSTTRLSDLVLQLAAARSPFFGEPRLAETDSVDAPVADPSRH